MMIKVITVLRRKFQGAKPMKLFVTDPFYQKVILPFNANLQNAQLCLERAENLLTIMRQEDIKRRKMTQLKDKNECEWRVALMEARRALDRALNAYSRDVLEKTGRGEEVVF
jgi:hypothetical protein